jgi:predicted alpha/beta-fold hydrolase
MFGKALSDMMIKPGKSPVFETPADYKMEYENVSFKTADGVTLSGWLVKGNTNKVVIQSHFGVQCSRSGYTVEGKNFMSKSLWSTDIPFLKQVKHLNDKGYSVLMYDMRNHGNSEKTGWITWGKEERKDIVAAIKFINEHPSYQEADIHLLSICMGQAISTFAFGLEKEMKNFKNLKSMVSVQPLTYDYFMKSMGLPQFMINSTNKYNKKRNTDLTGDSFLPYVKDINVPTLVIQNENDPMTNMGMVKDYYNNLQVEKEILWLDLEKKRGAAYAWLGNHPEQVSAWFDKH